MARRTRLSNTHLAAALIALAPVPAHACYPDPAQVYDNAGTPYVALLRATVTSFEFSSEGTQSCFALDYQTQEVLIGEAKPHFNVRSCDENTSWTEDAQSYAKEFATFGFEAGATVFVGIVTDPAEGKIRHMIPSCWGALHVNLADLTDAEQTELGRDLIQAFKKPQTQ